VFSEEVVVLSCFDDSFFSFDLQPETIPPITTHERKTASTF
jgi:hypothetical protein